MDVELIESIYHWSQPLDRFWNILVIATTMQYVDFSMLCGYNSLELLLFEANNGTRINYIRKFNIFSLKKKIDYKKEHVIVLEENKYGISIRKNNVQSQVIWNGRYFGIQNLKFKRKNLWMWTMAKRSAFYQRMVRSNYHLINGQFAAPGMR